jgi:ADP-ribose pyrophosphatase
MADREVYRGRLIRVVEQEVVSRTGLRHFEVVRHPGAVVLCPLEGEDILLVRQPRPAAGETLIELPAGTLRPGEDPVAAAERECREEVGMRPQELTLLAQLFAAPGYSSELLHVYLARSLVPDALPADEDEELELVRMPLDMARQEAVSGNLRDAKTVAGVLLAYAYLGPGLGADRNA